MKWYAKTWIHMPWFPGLALCLLSFTPMVDAIVLGIIFSVSSIKIEAQYLWRDRIYTPLTCLPAKEGSVVLLIRSENMYVIPCAGAQ